MTTARPEPAPRWRDLVSEGRGPLLALILLGDWLVAADALVVTTILPNVGASLSGYEWFGWTASAFLTGTVVAGACAGWLSERIGLRMAMALAGLVLALGCAMSALAPNMAVFVAGGCCRALPAAGCSASSISPWRRASSRPSSPGCSRSPTASGAWRPCWAR